VGDARAVAPDPAILVADEPTGNLDEATGRQIVDLLFRAVTASSIRPERRRTVRSHRRARPLSWVTSTSVAPRASPSPGRSPRTRRSWWPTSPPATSTRPPAARSSTPRAAPGNGAAGARGRPPPARRGRAPGRRAGRRVPAADEPTGNLDEATGRQIVDLLFRLKRDRGATLVLVDRPGDGDALLLAARELRRVMVQPVPEADRLQLGAGVVADEPTGNLDEATGRQIVDLLFRLKRDRGATLVLVTHDNGLARLCDRTVRLRSGRIEEASGGRWPRRGCRWARRPPGSPGPGRPPGRWRRAAAHDNGLARLCDRTVRLRSGRIEEAVTA
jgi:predicted ABC-type transport system involved in lysophospholipase L1 biosynthesis ATPase subunit